MAELNDQPTLPELIRSLISDVSGLVRKEIDLAKAETSEKVSKALGVIEVLIVGVVLAIGAVGVLLSAAVSGVSVVLIHQGIAEPSANAIGALIVGVVVVIIAWVFISRGLAALRASNFKLDRTAESLRRDVNVVKEKL